jgi:hypothetical protein
MHIERTPSDAQVLQSLGVREVRGLSHRRSGLEGPYTSRVSSRTACRGIDTDSPEVKHTATEQSP